MKRFVLFVLAALALAASGSALATTTPPASGRHDLLTCPPTNVGSPPGQTGVLGGPGDLRGAISSTSDVYLSIAWGTLTQAQSINFLKVQNASVTVHKSDGSFSKTVSWVTGNTDVWTAPAQVSNPGGGGGMTSFWMTRAFVPFGRLAAGTYTVDASFNVTKPSFDGATTIRPQDGPWFAVSGCQMVVS